MALKSSPIAIVGVGCRFPGAANSPDDFWRLLQDGQDTWTEVPAGRYNDKSFHHPDPDMNGTFNHRGGHFVEQDIGAFDGRFFNIPPLECEGMDPQTRMQLEVAYEALESAGLPVESLAGSMTSVYISLFSHDYNDMAKKDLDDVPKYIIAGAGHATAAGRISYTFDLRGPAMTLDTGCSGGLVAVHQACQSLRTGEASIALAGGSNLVFNPDNMVSMSLQHFLSSEGKCYAFDDRGEGYGRGEGVATVVLKRLDDAFRDGDNIRGIIRGTGLNQDGKSQGLTMPNRAAQADLIRSVYRDAGLDPLHTTYIEAHGTGTVAGDAAELGAIRDTFGSRSSANPLYVGSVKNNIGHLEGTSGLAGLIKAVLVLEKDAIPPTINVQKLKECAEEAKMENINIATRPMAWPKATLPRVSINSFGYSGTNAHVIVESLAAYQQTTAPTACSVETDSTLSTSSVDSDRLLDMELSVRDPLIWEETLDKGRDFATPSTENALTAEKVQVMTNANWDLGQSQKGATTLEKIGTDEPSCLLEPDPPFRLFVLSANSETSLLAALGSFKNYVMTHTGSKDLSLSDMSHTLISRRSFLPWRTSFSANSLQGLQEALNNTSFKAEKASKNHRINFIFSGQGAQWFGMGRELMTVSSRYQESLVTSGEMLRELGARWSLIDELSHDKEASRVNQSEIGQPASTALQIALVDLLRTLGVVPGAVLGHSSGEIAAAYAVGALSHFSALSAAYHRGQLEVDKKVHRGAMLAVGLGEVETKPYIQRLRAGVAVIACSNSPFSSTVSGDESAVIEVQALLEADGVFARRLKVDTAYHSHHVEGVSSEYLERLRDLEERPPDPSIRFYSSVTAEEKTSGFGSSYWVDNLVSKVNFNQALQRLTHQQTADSASRLVSGPQLFIEIGPHSALAGPLRQTLGLNPDQKFTCLSTFFRGKDAIRSVIDLAGKLFEHGYQLNSASINSLGGKLPSQRVVANLPPYAWDHSNVYWHESRLSKSHRLRQNAMHDLLGTRITSSTTQEPIWRHLLSVDRQPWLKDHVIDGFVTFPGTGYVTMAIEAMRQFAADRPKHESVARYFLKDIAFTAALVIHDSSQFVETQIALRPAQNSAENTSYAWWEFRIFSVSPDKTTTEHCNGFISVQNSSTGDDVEANREEHEFVRRDEEYRDKAKSRCSEEIDCDSIYNDLQSEGNNYGPTFASMKLLKLDKSLMSAYGSVVIPDLLSVMPGKSMQDHVISPATLDALLHPAIALYRGHSNVGAMMLVGIKEMRVSADIANKAGKELEVFTTISEISQKTAAADISVVQSAGLQSRCMIHGTGLELRAVGMADSEISQDKNLEQQAFRFVWGPDVDHYQACWTGKHDDKDVLQSTPDPTTSLLDQVVAISVYDCLEKMAARKPIPRYSVLLEWMKNLKSPLILPKLDQKPGAIFEEARHSGREGEALYRLGPNLSSVCSGEAEVDDLLGENLCEGLCRNNTRSQTEGRIVDYVKQFAFKHPAASILELNAGAGEVAASLLQTLASNTRALPIERYDIANIHPSDLENVKAQLKDELWVHVVHTSELDISRDPLTQGFGIDAYDLVIISDMDSGTHEMDALFPHIRSLLKPQGQLVTLQTLKRPLYQILLSGLVPEWCSDGLNRTAVTDATKLLENASLKHNFRGSKGFVDPVGKFVTTIYTAGTTASSQLDLSAIPVKILRTADHTEFLPNLTERLVYDFRTRGFDASHTALVSTETISEDLYIVVDDAENPVLLNESSDLFTGITRLFGAASRVLWLTANRDTPSSFMERGLIGGFARVARAENVTMKLVTLDIQDGGILGNDEILNAVMNLAYESFFAELPSTDLEYIYKDRQLLIPRLLPDEAVDDCIKNVEAAPMTQIQLFRQPRHVLKLEVTKPGLLDSIRFTRDASFDHPLGAKDVEVEVHACGLNFKDVFIALGQMKPNVKMAGEFSGIITSTGSDVSRFAVGERVCGMDATSYASFVRVSESLVCHLPKSMSFTTAASIPVAFSTAYHGLVEVARLRSDQTVLISAASGGVGQAAIQVAQDIGAEIFATVGSESKKKMLMRKFAISEDHIFSSRLRTFASGIRRMTKGKGVDVVLNSSSGQALQDSFNCIAHFGVFVELGKTVSPSKSVLGMEPFDRNVTFAAIDLSLISKFRREKIGQLLSRVLAIFETGKYYPVEPVTVLPISELQEAFRMVQARKHTGKIVLEVAPVAAVEVLAKPSIALNITEDSTYIIAGGLGALGQPICRFLLVHGAKSIVVLSRRQLTSAEQQKFKNECGLRDARLEIVSCDICDSTKLPGALSPYLCSMPPVRGLIQATMVLRDGPLSSMSHDDFRAAVRPKVHGTKALLQALSGQPLDFVFMLSSTSGIIGNVSQANYAAGNTYLDSLATFNDDQTTHFFSLDAGIVEDVGILASEEVLRTNLMLRGFMSMTADQVNAVLGYVVSGQAQRDNCRQCVTGVNHSSLLHSTNARKLENPLFCHLSKAAGLSQATKSVDQTDTLQSIVCRCQDLSELTIVVAKFFVDRMSTIVAVDAEDIDLQGRAIDYGLDSLVLIELKNWIAQEFRAKLQVSEISDSSSLIALAELIISRSALLAENGNTRELGSKAGQVTTPQTETPSETSANALVPPRQPLPELDNSLEQFLEVAQTAFGIEDYRALKEMAQEMRSPGSFGNELQSRLARLANDPQISNWQSEAYAKWIHLRDRLPLMPWQNFFGTHVQGSFAHSPAERAAIVAHSAFQFKGKLEAEGFQNTDLVGQTLHSQGLGYIFNATREPALEQDRVVKFPGNDYLVAFRRGYAYQIPLVVENESVPYEVLRCQFQQIIDSSEQATWAGSLTADTRDSWAGLRKQLINVSVENSKWVHKIEAAAFVISLDHTCPKTSSERGHQFMHGFGLNRWSDKTMSYLVSDNGFSGAVAEHAMMDAVTALQLNHCVNDAIQALKPSNCKEPVQATAISGFAFQLTPHLDAQIERILKATRIAVATKELNSIELSSVHNRFFRTHRMPPNSAMQVLTQLALRRYFGKTVPSYENVSQATFLDGRVEFMPGHWPAVVKFCSAAEDEDTETSKLRTLFIKAIQQHSTNLARTVRGQGFHRHLLSLKWAVDRNEETPNFLKSPLFDQAGPNLVLTNNLSSRSMEAGVWLRHPDSLWIHSEIEERHGDKVRIFVWGPTGRTNAFKSLLEKSAEQIVTILEG